MAALGGGRLVDGGCAQQVSCASVGWGGRVGKGGWGLQQAGGLDRRCGLEGGGGGWSGGWDAESEREEEVCLFFQLARKARCGPERLPLTHTHGTAHARAPPTPCEECQSHGSRLNSFSHRGVHRVQTLANREECGHVGLVRAPSTPLKSVAWVEEWAREPLDRWTDEPFLPTRTPQMPLTARTKLLTQCRKTETEKVSIWAEMRSPIERGTCGPATGRRREKYAAAERPQA